MGPNLLILHRCYKQLAVQWLNEVLSFVSSSVMLDSLVLRNRLLLVAAKRYIILVSVIPSTLSGQTLFDKRYATATWNCGRKVLETTDGYVAGGYHIAEDLVTLKREISAVLWKTDFNGDTLMTFIFSRGDTAYVNLPSNPQGLNSDESCTDMVKITDSNFVAVSWDQRFATHLYDYDVLLIKFNKDLDTLWTRSISHPNDTSLVAQSLIQTADGGFVVCGKAYSFANANYVGFMLKTDSLGNLLWLHTYNNPGPGQSLYDVKETPSGDLITSGTQIINAWNDDYSPVLFKTNAFGIINIVYNIPQINGFGASISYTNDGNYLCYNTTFPPVSIRKIIKFSEAGILFWSKDFGTYNNGGITSVIPAIGNGYIACGITDIPQVSNDWRGFLVRFDENGDSLWYREFNTPALDLFWDMESTSDGNYIITGETYDNGSLAIESRFWLVKTDSLGLFTGFNDLVGVEPSVILGLPFPNPVSDYFEVSFNIPETQLPDKGRKGVELLLFDQSGKQIATQSITSGTSIARFEMSLYAAGTYLVVFTIDGYNAGSRRVVKN